MEFVIFRSHCNEKNWTRPDAWWWLPKKKFFKKKLLAALDGNWAEIVFKDYWLSVDGRYGYPRYNDISVHMYYAELIIKLNINLYTVQYRNNIILKLLIYLTVPFIYIRYTTFIRNISYIYMTIRYIETYL